MGGRISLASDAAIGQARYNKDMYRDISKLVTGRRSKKAYDGDGEDLRLFHRLPEELSTSLLAMSKTRGAKFSDRHTMRECRCRRRKTQAY